MDAKNRRLFARCENKMMTVVTDDTRQVITILPGAGRVNPYSLDTDIALTFASWRRLFRPDPRADCGSGVGRPSQADAAGAVSALYWRGCEARARICVWRQSGPGHGLLSVRQKIFQRSSALRAHRRFCERAFE